MERLEKALARARADRVEGMIDASAGLPPQPGPDKVIEISGRPPLRVTPVRPQWDAQDTIVTGSTRTIAIDPRVLRSNGILTPEVEGPAGHAFKMLRTQVLQRMHQRQWTTLAVISPTPQDGKTFTAINLTIAIASDTKHSTLLVDLDLRNPSIHKRFGFEPEVGVEQCLRNEVEVSSALVNPVGYAKVVLLPARDRVPNSSDLLSSDQTRATIRELKNRYPNRIVIFDLPPMLGADDALAFAPHVDATLVVIGEERTRKPDVMRCFELMQDLPILGTVLNGSRTDKASRYAY